MIKMEAKDTNEVQYMGVWPEQKALMQETPWIKVSQAISPVYRHH
jgi:hypothetical protein